MNSPSLIDFQAWIVHQQIQVQCASCYFMTDNAFKAKDIGLRAQKKLLSRMASKNVAKVFIDGNTASLLDNVYRLAKQYMGSKKEAERLVKNIIKTVIKIAILHRNNQFSAEENKISDKFYQKFQNLQMSIISFYEVDFSFDLQYLQKLLSDIHQLLKEIVHKHLTEKSLNRIDEVFHIMNDPTFLEAIFKADSPYREIMGKIVQDLNKALENPEENDI